MAHQTLVVLDFGSQVTQLIARRVRELGVYAEILPYHTSAEKLARARPRPSSSAAVRRRSTTRARRSTPPSSSSACRCSASVTAST
nr:hypothetical protein [Nannocystis pusilla]